jgi:hypothetical protein
MEKQSAQMPFKQVVQGKRKYLLVIICILVLYGYFTSTFYAEAHRWKHTDGLWIGDFIEFDNVIRIEDRKVYQADSVLCQVKSVNYRSIYIIDEKGKIGRYVRKD